MNTLARALLVSAVATTAVSFPAEAICVASSGVFGSATLINATTWMYSFSVQNGCNPAQQQFMTNFYLPFFADAGISSLVVPPPDNHTTTSTIAWTATIEPTVNLFGLPNAGVIDFEVTATPTLEASPGVFTPGVGYYGVDGFSYRANFAPTEGPAAVRQTPSDGGAYNRTTLVFVDPPIPASPFALAALSSAPEPGSIVLVGTGLALVGLWMSRIRRRARPARSLRDAFR